MTITRKEIELSTKFNPLPYTKPPHFTGRFFTHIAAEMFGKDYWVVTFDDDSHMSWPRNSEEDDRHLVTVVDSRADVQEWTLIRAFSEQDARNHWVKAHDQWYAKENGDKLWLWHGWTGGCDVIQS